MTDKKPSKPSSWNIPDHDPDNKTGKKTVFEAEEGDNTPNNPEESQKGLSKPNPWATEKRTKSEDDLYNQRKYSSEFNENHPSSGKKSSFFSPLVLIIIAILIIGFVGFGFTTGSDQLSTDNTRGLSSGPGMVYNIMWLAFIGASILAMARKNLGQTLKYALGWGFILLVAVGSVNIWMDLREQGGVKTAMGYDQNRVEIPRQNDGHYYVRAFVNGQKIRFMIDTGATDVVLTQADGKKAGFNLKKSDFYGRASTANGTVAFAPVRFDSISIGNIELENIRGSINGAPLGTSLLGMSYLGKLSSFEFRGDTLILNK